jgi:pyruvate dehydrogenase E2 component (dihydrolipoyllysine-residue acetyltransferase)
MAREFKLPDIGEGISEVELLQWYVQEGETVREDQNLAEIETDKAVADLPSPYAGVVSRLHFKPGERIPVGSTLVSFAEQEQQAVEPVQSRTEAPVPEQPSGLDQSSAAADTTNGQAASPSRLEPGGGRVLAAPAVRRRARELGLELTAVQGSGPGGRVTSEDLERYARAGQRAATADSALSPEVETALVEATTPEHPPEAPRLAPGHTPLPDFAQWGAVERIALTATRRQISRKMVQSLYTAPHAAALDEVDVTELEALRKRSQERLQDRHTHLTLLPFVMKAAVAALKRFPALNASLDDDTQELILKRYYHLGIAMDTERGLIVPVIREVDRKSIAELAAELAEKVQRTREGKINLEELRGGTFTLTNAGALGGAAFLPIINYPEVAILGLGRAQPKPVVREGQIVVRTMLPLSIAFDHRVADGADVVRFLTLVMRLLEDPSQLLLDA